MKLLKNISFDEKCARGAAAIALLAVVAALSAMVDIAGEHIPRAARLFALFAEGSSACGMLTLYFNMLAYSLLNALPRERNDGFSPTRRRGRLLCVMNGISYVLKLFFLLQPFSPRGGTELALYAAALMTDAAISGAVSLRVWESTDVDNPAE